MTPRDFVSPVIIPERIPRLIRWLGARFKDGKRAYRMRWGEMGFRRGLALELILFEEHYSLRVHALWTYVYVRLPFLQRWHRQPRDMHEAWGGSTFDGALHLHWAARTKIITAPWRNWVQTVHDVRRPDGSWVPFVGSWEEKREGRELDHRGQPLKEPDGRLIEEFPYRYVLRSGEVQERTARVSVERRRRKLKWLRWLPFARTSHSIDVAFSDEVGERTGSWKGGTVGCGYTLREGETARECLYRMQEERKF